MVRRIIPLCITVPLILDWLQLRSVRSHLFSDPVATWWFAAATILAMVLIIWWCAGSVSRDDRERRRLEGQLRRMAPYDPLNGLLNRGGFEAEAVSLLSRSERYGHEASLLLLDLDRFKPINDQLGHATGDRVLRRWRTSCWRDCAAAMSPPAWAGISSRCCCWRRGTAGPCQWRRT